MRLIHHLRGNAVAYLALTVALGGTSYAAVSLPKNSVGSKQIKANAVTSSKVKDRSLLAKDFKSGQLPKGAKGDTGPQGPKGDTGPSTGAAGGDLTGSYPNPAIKTGAVTPAKQSGVPSVRLYRTGTQAVANNTNEQVSWNGEESDPANMHDPANPTRIVAPIDGVYLVTGNVTWALNAAGVRIVDINASNRVRGLGDAYIVNPSAAVEEPLTYTTQVPLTAGQYVEINTFQNSGGTINLQPFSSAPETTVNAQMTWIAPLG